MNNSKCAYYLSPTTSITGKYIHCFGLFETIGGLRDISGFPCWALDNGRFTGAWTEIEWIKMLEFYTDLKKCLFALVPDCPRDAIGTLEWFWRWRPYVERYGYKVGLTSQNGMSCQMVPWDDIDALFIAGDDKHKRGPEGRNLIIEAKIRGKHVHVGRVNSGSVIRDLFWMADSWDGTTLARNPSQQYTSIGSAVLYARHKQNKIEDWSAYKWSLSQLQLSTGRFE